MVDEFFKTLDLQKHFIWMREGHMNMLKNVGTEGERMFHLGAINQIDRSLEALIMYSEIPKKIAEATKQEEQKPEPILGIRNWI